MTSLEDQEKDLERQLRKLCDGKGAETSPKESACIFNELGLLYKSRSPDKIALIQSAALLNAAIVRVKTNEKFKNDLVDLCSHVLEIAKADEKDGSCLVDIADIAKDIIVEMRKKVQNGVPKVVNIANEEDNDELELAYIKQVRAVQTQLTADYKGVMATLSAECVKILGKPPCKYALMGMGSIARNEITPYSDFEHILVLEDDETKEKEELEKIKEYFRWYSMIFHIVIVNLKETDLYSVCISCLNNHTIKNGNWFYDKYTPQGISFDGMMPHACHFPLGKTQVTEDLPWTTELIKPISEMIKYLDGDKQLKEGYKLGDILTRTCFIEGDESVSNEFDEKVAEIINEQNTPNP